MLITDLYAVRLDDQPVFISHYEELECDYNSDKIGPNYYGLVELIIGKVNIACNVHGL